MKFETLIPTGDLENHEKELKRRLQKIELLFADKKASRAENKNTFFDALEEYTSLVHEIKYSEISEQELQDFVLKINEIYDKKEIGWEEQILSSINEKMSALGVNEKKNDSERIGVMYFDKRSYEDRLENFGIDYDDEILSIHISEAFLHKDTALSSSSIRAIMSKLAETIVEKYPQIKAVVGESWLIDTPIAKRLGFTIVENVDVPQNNNSMWYQFIKQDGQIDEKRVSDLLENGEPPFKAKLGIIPVVKFLELYLPDDKRGKDIILKERVPADVERTRIVQEEGQALRDSWSSLSSSEVIEKIGKSKELNLLLDELGYRERFLALIAKSKVAGLEWEQLKDIKELAEIGKAIDIERKKKEWRDKVVVIE